MVAVAPRPYGRPRRPRPLRAAERPATVATVGAAPHDDQRVVVHDVAWDAYVAINDALGDRGTVRVCYCEGTLELMSPGFLHEGKKKLIARLLELYALHHDLPLQGTGSTTTRRRPSERGAEPDESYFLGEAAEGEPPHLAIEIAVSRSAIDKLDLYAGLGVRELWIWQDDRLVVHTLGKAGYRTSKRSKLLPSLDVEELASFARRPDQAAAARAYWKKLQKGP